MLTDDTYDQVLASYKALNKQIKAVNAQVMNIDPELWNEIAGYASNIGCSCDATMKQIKLLHTVKPIAKTANG